MPHFSCRQQMSRMALLFAGVMLPAFYGFASAQEDSRPIARGVVFEDRNANGKRDEGEPSLSGVAVSNQLDVVLTDADGRYELPVTDDTILFVSKPATHNWLLDENRIPRFYYVHRPQGSPPLEYKGVAPTGPLPASVDFPLLPITSNPAPDFSFRVIAIADPQPDSYRELGHVRDDILSELTGQEAAFLIILGDIMFDNLDLFPPWIQAAGKVGLPLVHVAGNHDLNHDAANDRDSDDTFNRLFGPSYYSFDWGQAHFVILDNILWKGAPETKYDEGLDERQLQWLAADLSHVPADRTIVLCSHSPILFPEGRKTKNTDKLFSILQNRLRILAINGHTHYTFHHFFGPDDGWKGDGVFHQFNCTTASGSWWGGPQDLRGIPVADQRDGTPNGYTYLDFAGPTYRQTYKAAGFDRSHQMRIYPPGTVPSGEEPRKTFWVNVFDGGPKSIVEYSLDEAPFLAMTQVREHDPLAVALYTGPNEIGKSWVDPVTCHHLWRTVLPDRPKAGVHRLTIRHTDMYGRIWEQSTLFNR